VNDRSRCLVCNRGEHDARCAGCGKHTRGCGCNPTIVSIREFHRCESCREHDPFGGPVTARGLIEQLSTLARRTSHNWADIEQARDTLNAALRAGSVDAVRTAMERARDVRDATLHSIRGDA
jgi:hypothetical protein